MILIRGCTKIRRDWRVEFVCGHRAESTARKDAALIERVGATLKCAAGDLSGSVERLLRAKEVSAKRLKSLLPKVAAADAAVLLASVIARSDGVRIVAHVLEGVESDYLQHLGSALAGTENVVAFLADGESGAVVFAQNPKCARDMNALLQQMFEKFPGKGGGSKDFARGALTSATNCIDAIRLAEVSV
jgi:alanyl-tRNA synthetase